MLKKLTRLRNKQWYFVAAAALLILGTYETAAHATELPSELNPQFLANNLWLLVASILIVFMNAGFAMVEAGMCRHKNTVNILYKNLIVFTLAVSAYFLVGYSLMYGNPIVDGWFYFKGLFFDPTVTADMVNDAAIVPSLDFLFQAAFAGTAATIVSGLVAERIKFSQFILFSIGLTAFLYPILGAWKWNGGWLDQLGFIDFAGSTVVHSVGAWAGLVGAIVLGPRLAKFDGERANALPGHNMALATLGGLILWIGWYGFNPGSQLAFDSAVPYIAVTTTLGAAGGGIAGTITSQLKNGKADLSMTINGILAGLVSVTAGCNTFGTAGAWIVGFIGGVLVVFSVDFIDSLRIDDPVGAFSVHGTGGVWGTLAVGLFSKDAGLFYGQGFSQVFVQLVGVLSYGLCTVIFSYALWQFLAKVNKGLRVSKEEELAGLDASEHGMSSYIID
jgi:Amt family ammonium transporter